MSEWMDCPSCEGSIRRDEFFCHNCKTYIIRKYNCVLRDIESVEPIRRLDPIMERQGVLIHIWFSWVFEEKPPGCPALAFTGEEYRAALITPVSDRDPQRLVVDTGECLFAGRIEEENDTICYSVPPDVMDDATRRLAHDLCLPSQTWQTLKEAKARRPSRQIEVLMNPGRRWSKPPITAIIQQLCPECGLFDVTIEEIRYDPVTGQRIEKHFWNKSKWERAKPFYAYKCQFCGYFWIWAPGRPKPKKKSREEMINRRKEILEERRR